MKAKRKHIAVLVAGLLIPILAQGAGQSTKADETAATQTPPISPAKPMASPEVGKAGAAGQTGAGASDSSQMAQWQDEKKRLEAALPPGQNKAFYRQELDRLGYKVTSVNKDKPNYVEYEVVKSAISYEVQIDVDKGSGKATKVEIEPNVWKARSTQQAVDRSKPTQ